MGAGAALTPNSASTAGSFPSPPASGHHGFSGGHPGYPDPEGRHHGHGYSHDDTASTGGDEPSKKRQKRNKPTLSCQECVERKTKVSILIHSPTTLTETGRLT